VALFANGEKDYHNSYYENMTFVSVARPECARCYINGEGCVNNTAIRIPHNVAQDGLIPTSK